MSKKGLVLSTLLLSALLCSCASTTFESTWRNPEGTPLRFAGRKVAAVFVTNDAVFRRRAEDAMAREITARGAVGVPSYTFLGDKELKDRDAAKAKAEAEGFAGSVVMRVVGSRTVYEREPAGGIWLGGPYRHFWGGYWGWGWGSVWAPGYLRAERIVKVETLVYSLDRDELVWAGVSRTFDPGRMDKFIEELSGNVSKEMTREGLFARG